MNPYEAWKRGIATHTPPVDPESDVVPGLSRKPEVHVEEDPVEARFRATCHNLGLSPEQINLMCRCVVEKEEPPVYEKKTLAPMTFEDNAPQAISGPYIKGLPEPLYLPCRRWHLLTFFQIIGWLLALTAVVLGVWGVAT